MRLLKILSLPITLLISLYTTTTTQSTFNTTSPKRGLIDISTTSSTDTSLLLQQNSDITWYYNYGPSPSSSLQSSHPSLLFVPMLFNTAPQTPSFLDKIKNLMNSGINVTYVMSYNEPDGAVATGGSAISPEAAAVNWKVELEPLRGLGVKVGAPAVQGGQGGFNWLNNFFDACDGGCTADFMPVHWYGPFDGLTSNMGQKRANYSNLPLWITEYALPDSSPEATQDFFNKSTEYFDRLDYVEFYSYFGSFRSTQSNVGPNVAMLDGQGKLTSIGNWYLGGKATDDVPNSSVALQGISGAGALVVIGAVVFSFMS